MFEIPDNKNIEKFIFKIWTAFLCKLILVLIHLKYWNYNSPYLELPYLPHHFCQIFNKSTETLLQHNPRHVVYWFPYLVLRHSTMHYYRYWIYQTICQCKPIEFNIKLYKDHNTVWVKQATSQKAKSLRAVSLSILDNTFNSNSIFNTKYAEFSTKW